MTGAFGYSGRWIAKHLLANDRDVITLTNKKPASDPFGGRVTAFPLRFDDPAALAKSLEGTQVMYNTYWVRFNHKMFTHEEAVRNSGVLFDAAKRAGVRRIVHVSIANPSENSPFEYYRGKARIERMLQNSGVEQTILRPTVLFGDNNTGDTDILVNNIAWTLRRFPAVGYFGSGRYRIRPVHVDDFARFAVACGSHSGNEIIDAVGPEDYTYKDLLRAVSKAIRCRNLIVRVPVVAGYSVAKMIGWWHRDRFLTWEEIGALTANLLTSDAPAVGETKLSNYLRERSETVGKHYASELARRS